MLVTAQNLSNSSSRAATDLKAKLFRGFSDPSRLAILETLRDGPLTVGEIVARTGLSQSNVSNHLGCLRDCGLVTAQPQGRFVHYRMSDERVGQLLHLADELLAEVARGVYECTRYTHPDGPTPDCGDQDESENSR